MIDATLREIKNDDENSNKKKKKKMVKARRAQIANAILIGHRARFHFIQTRL